MTEDRNLQQWTGWRYPIERRWRDALKSETSIVFGTLAIAALALFALGSTLGNQQTLAIVYAHGHGHVVVLHHQYCGHHVVVILHHAGHVVVPRS
ncbi:MAG TPA: hypothetical protein VEL11_19405 [Candidatus Bathyarchaeia archaeon]|nr:hypothetical protein [Candidatus Bathyarchaeia archaeon]